MVCLETKKAINSRCSVSDRCPASALSSFRDTILEFTPTPGGGSRFRPGRSDKMLGLVLAVPSQNDRLIRILRRGDRAATQGGFSEAEAG